MSMALADTPEGGAGFIIISIWVTIRGGLVTRYRTKKIKFLDFLCSSDCSSIFFRIFSLIPNNASLQEVV